MTASLSVIIPVYNEVQTVRILLDQVIGLNLPGLSKEILVVESASTDGTREIIKEFEVQGKIEVIYEDRPRGKGRALRLALGRAKGDIILIQDADLEYKISDYPELLAPILKGETKFVLGSRHLGRGEWKIRRFVTGKMYAHLINWGGLIYTWLFNILYGVSLTDPATMFKVFKRECLQGIQFKSSYFELDWEIVAKLVRRGYLPVEVPVSYASRTMEEGKKIRFWRDGFLVLLAIIRFRWFD